MAELVQRQSALVDIVGSNSPRVKAQTIQGTQTPISPDITDQKLNESRQSVQKMYADTVQGLTDVATAKSAELSGKGRGNGASEIAGIMGAITTGVGVYRDMDAKRKLAEQEKAAEERKVAMTLVNQNVRSAIQQKISDLNTAINQHTDLEGVNKIRMDIDQILAEQRSQLDPKDYQEIENLVVASRNEATDQTYTRLWNTQDEIAKQQLAGDQAALTIQLAPELGAIRSARSQPEAADALNMAMQKLVERTPNMSPEDRMKVAIPLLQQMGADATTSFASANASGQVLTDTQAVIPLIEEGRQKYGDDPNAFDAYINTLKAQYPGAAPLLGTARNNFDMRSMALDAAKTSASLQQIGIQSNDEEMQTLHGDYNNALIQQKAWQFFAGGGNMAAEVERIRNSTIATQQEKSAVSLYDQLNKDRERFNTLSSQVLAGNADLERLAYKVDPTRLGDDTYTAPFRDPLTGALSAPVKIAGGAYIIRPTASMDEFNAEVARVQDTKRQLDELIFSRQQQGIDLTNPTNRAFQSANDQVIQQGNAIVQQQRAAGTLPPTPPPQGARGTPNFSRVDGQGRIPTQPIVPLQRLVDGRRGDANTSLISPISNHSAIITDGYGDPGNGENQHHGRFHSGMDIASDSTGDVAARAVSGGTVTNVADWGGFGGTVTVRSPNGHTEQYSHLRAFSVKPGQQIPPGTQLGLMGGGDGDPMHGNSTGRHIHFTVYRPDIKDDAVGTSPGDSTIDPSKYLATLQYGSGNNNNQQGLPPNQDHAEDGVPNHYTQVPRSAIVLPSGFSFSGGIGGSSVFTPAQMSALGVGGAPQQGVPTARVATQATPVVGGMAPIARNQYPDVGSKNDNYGYEELRQRPKLREAINLVAKALDVPGMWVADVMNAESSFNRGVPGGDGGAYTGLIQINQDWLAGRGLSPADLGSNDEVWQAQNVVIPYFQDILKEQGGKYNTIEDLYAAVLGGGGFYALPAARRTSGDSNDSFPQHMSVMGNAAGRRYRTTWQQSMLPSQPTQQIKEGDTPRTIGNWSMVG